MNSMLARVGLTIDNQSDLASVVIGLVLPTSPPIQNSCELLHSHAIFMYVIAKWSSAYGISDESEKLANVLEQISMCIGVCDRSRTGMATTEWAILRSAEVPDLAIASRSPSEAIRFPRRLLETDNKSFLGFATMLASKASFDAQLANFIGMPFDDIAAYQHN